LRDDLFAGITLGAYAVPEGVAYATLAGLPPQVGIYGYLLGGLGYALFGSSRHLAIGPTSAISLMVGVSVAPLAMGDPVRYAQIATLSAFVAAAMCIVAWLLRLSTLINFISETVMLGFKAGAGLSIAATQNTRSSRHSGRWTQLYRARVCDRWPVSPNASSRHRHRLR